MNHSPTSPAPSPRYRLLAALSVLLGFLWAAPALLAADAATLGLEAVRKGHALLRANRTREACAAFDRAASLLPTWWIARYERARCGRLLGHDFETLAPHVEAALKFAPANAMVHELAGFVHEDAGSLSRARDEYREALRLYPNLSGAARRFAWLELEAGDAAAALARFRDLLVRHPNDIQALEGIARAALATGDHAEAERALIRLGARSSYPAQALARLAELYRRLGKSGAAERVDRTWRTSLETGAPAPDLKPVLAP